jgi:pyruvate dehydrogenase E2 component (dihydrolipoamide acetyltransferase)
MAHVLIMPRQGNTVESCIIQEWKVKEGDAVKADTTVAVVETDKATFDVPAGAEGQVLKILHGDGDDVPVLQPIAVIGAAGEDWSAALGSAGGAGEEALTKAQRTQREEEKENKADNPPLPSVASVPPCENSETKASPRARNLAAAEGVALGGIAGSGPGGRIIERDVTAALAGRPPLTAAARASGGAIPSVGTGLGGRVTVADRAAAPSSSVPSVVSIQGEGSVTETPIKGVRKLISDRMLASLSEMAQFTLNASAPAVKLQELRARFKAAGEGLGVSKVTVNDLVLYAVSRVLPQYPFMNALKIGDTLKTYERIHLGLAVDTPKGLMVPVIRNANLLSLKDISCEAKRLAAACQGGTVKPDELSGSTFTVTNLGSFGVTNFTPIINAPEVAILGVCSIELKPIETDDDDECGFAFAPHIGFSLTINHQVVDGAPAARFLKALCAAVADLDLLLAV